jgi:hypothetical protein
MGQNKVVGIHVPMKYSNTLYISYNHTSKIIKANIPLGENATSSKSIVANFTVAHIIVRWETHSGSMSLH